METPGFPDALRARLQRRTRVVLDRADRAAVLVPIVLDGGPVRLILTRRTEALATHRGQVAFPGGRVEAQDLDPVSAALREAQEEIGLPPVRVETIGLLDDRLTRDGVMAVTPCVGIVRDLPPLRPCSAEVARVFTIPLEALGRPGGWRREEWTLHGRPVPVDFFEHDGEVLWGLSARIVKDLISLMPASQ